MCVHPEDTNRNRDNGQTVWSPHPTFSPTIQPTRSERPVALRLEIKAGMLERVLVNGGGQLTLIHVSPLWSPGGFRWLH